MTSLSTRPMMQDSRHAAQINSLPHPAPHNDLISDTAETLAEAPNHQSSQLDSSLLTKLPRELRDQIYREAVVDDEAIPIHVKDYETQDGEKRSYLQIGHPLLRVCKQARHEVAEIYYLGNTFCITNDLFEPRAMKQLLQVLRPWAKMITRLDITHDGIEPFGPYVEFSVAAFNGRIGLIQLADLPNLDFLDTSKMILEYRDERVCFCKASRLASKHGSLNVLDWLQKYAGMVVQSRAERANSYTPYCWTCAGVNAV